MAGPGTELLKIMPTLAKVAAWATLAGDCGCKDYADLMDTWGVAGCLRREPEIVDRLLSKAPALIRSTQYAHNEAVGLVAQAIENARKSSSLVCDCGRAKAAYVGMCFWCDNKQRLDR